MGITGSACAIPLVDLTMLLVELALIVLTRLSSVARKKVKDNVQALGRPDHGGCGESSASTGRSLV